MCEYEDVLIKDLYVTVFISIYDLHITKFTKSANTEINTSHADTRSLEHYLFVFLRQSTTLVFLTRHYNVISYHIDI